MFENAENTSLASFTRDELIAHLNKNATISESPFELNHKSFDFHTVCWNNFVHFDLSYTPWKHLGYKIAVAAHINALTEGKLPDYLFLDITSSSKYTLEALEELSNGFFHAAKEMNVKSKINAISTTAQGIFLNATAINGNIALLEINNKINEGDLVCVTGDLGAAYLGLLLLEREKRIFNENKNIQPDLEGKDYIVGKQLKPHLPLEALELIRAAKIKINAIRHCEKGLSVALNDLKNTFNHGIVIYEDKLPIDTETLMQCIDFGIDGTVATLNGGEDYELVLVIPQTEFEAIEKLKAQISIIGYVSGQTPDVIINLKSGNSEKVIDLKLN